MICDDDTAMKLHRRRLLQLAAGAAALPALARRARAQNVINEAEAEQLRAAADAVAAAIAVDDFAPEALARRKASPTILQATGTIALQRSERQTRSAPLAPGDP